MAVAAFKSTTRRQWDIRGVEIEISPVSSSRNESPPRRSMSRNPSPTRRSMSRAPSPTRRSRGESREPVRRSLSKAPSPTRGRRERGVSREPMRRSLSKAPSPTRGRRGVSREPVRRSVSRQPSPSRRAVSRAPSPSRRAVSRAPSPSRRAVSRALSPSRRAVSRAPSPTRGRRGVSRGLSPTRGRRAVSRGPSPTRGRASPATSGGGRATTRATSPSRRLSSVGPRSRATSPQRQQPVAKPSGRVLRRTQSSADMALSQFLVDAAVNVGSPPAIVTRQSGIGLRGSPRTLPSDSESEVEPRYARRLDRSFSSRRDSSDNESVQSSRSASRRMSGLRAGSLRRTSTAGERTPHELRRSVTNLDISDAATPVYYQNAATPVYYQKPKPGDDHRLVEKDNGEAQGDKNIEEKTIQEVHPGTVVQTLCYNCLYDVSATADAPADAISPIGAVKMKVLGNSNSTNSREAPPGDVDFVAMYNARCAEVRQAVSDARVELENVKEEELRRVIEAKLELSEKKVSELWSQYATEERRCLHLVKSVKDIKDGSGAIDVDPDELGMEVTLPEEKDLKQYSHRYPMDDMDEADFIRQSLDEEAARYFEECAIIANFDANVADDISLSSGRISDGETTVNDEPRTSSRRQSSDSQEVISVRKKQITPLDDEGMLLPWLDWEPEVDLGRKERLEKAVCDFREWKSAWARKSVEWGKSSNRERGRDEGAVNVDEFLFERTRLQPRIAHGRMLVCGGKR